MTQEVPEGERLAKVEASVNALVGRVDQTNADMRDLRTDLREIRAVIDRNFLWTLGVMLGVMVPMWVSLIVALVLRT